MYLKIIFFCFIALGLIVFQVSFVSALPGILANFNIILVVLLLLLAYTNFGMALLWALALGGLMDIVGFSSFALNTIVYFFIIIATNFLLENIFTNRSLYSFLALTFFATILYELMFYGAWLVSLFFSGKKASIPAGQNLWWAEGQKVLANILLMFFLFYVISFFSKKFKPVFLIK